MRVPCIAILLRPRIASPSRGGFPSPQFGFLIFVPLVWRLRRYWPSGLRTSVVASLPPPAILGSSVRHVPPYYVLGEGLQRSFVGRHLRLQLFLRVFYRFACLCSNVCFPIRGLPKFIPEPAYFRLGRFGRFLHFGKGCF